MPSQKAIVAVGSVLALGLAVVIVAQRRSVSGRAELVPSEERSARAFRERPRSSPRARRVRPRGPAERSSASSAPGAASSGPVGAAATRPSTRVEQLATQVLSEAVRRDWMTIDERGTPCPPERVRIVYDAPSDLEQYEKGAYFEPLGPAPSESSDEVNGLLLCDGHTHLYRGFEAYWRADRGQWDVFPFPVIE